MPKIKQNEENLGTQPGNSPGSGGGTSAAGLYRKRGSDVPGSSRSSKAGGNGMNDKKCATASEFGGEAAIAAMDEYSRAEIGRKTYRFVRRCMQDPELRRKIKERAAELRAANS